jgi:SPP1 family phage portal protein
MSVKELIKKDQDKKEYRYIARKYYKYNPEKEAGEITSFFNGKIHTTKVDKMLYTNFFRLLVNQKINYILAKEPEIKENNVITVVKISDMLEEALLNASLDSRAWLFLYVEDNKLDWIFVHDSEIIPIYDKYNKNIEAVIRYYKSPGNEKIITVETWTLTGVKIEYLEKDSIIKTEERTHWVDNTFFRGELINSEGKNLPFIPFIPLFNNRDKNSDLRGGIQELLDFYNSISTGLVDNIDRFQEAITKLKGFSADAEEMELIEKNMRKYKQVSIPNENGDVEFMKIEIPIEARKLILEMLKENIFKIGQGLDPDRLAGESNITNVVIKSRYSALDMKANGTEKQLKLFYENFINCLNLFYRSNIDPSITFNRSMIFNEGEVIDNCIKSMDLLDLETILENHPWVTDVKKVMARIKAEKEDNFQRQQDLIKNNITKESNMGTDDLTNQE